MGFISQPSTVDQPLFRDAPELLLQARQIAQGWALPLVSTQQSPQTGFLQRAQGPAAKAPQPAQCTKPPPSPLDINAPLIGAQLNPSG